MDKEQREALALSKDDLLAKKAAGHRADVARTPPARLRKPRHRGEDAGHGISFSGYAEVNLSSLEIVKLESARPLVIPRADVKS